MVTLPVVPALEVPEDTVIAPEEPVPVPMLAVRKTTPPLALPAPLTSLVSPPCTFTLQTPCIVTEPLPADCMLSSLLFTTKDKEALLVPPEREN